MIGDRNFRLMTTYVSQPPSRRALSATFVADDDEKRRDVHFLRLFVARDVRFCICKFMCSCCSLTTTCALTYLSVIFSEDITQSFTLHIHTCHQLLYFLASTTRTSSAWSASIARARTSLCRAGTCASAPRVRSARSGTSVPCVGRRRVWCCERSLCDVTSNEASGGLI